MQTITAVIPVKNEENNIERCIKSVLWCDKVLVICTGTDKTAEIARSLGAEVVEKSKSNTDDFEELQRNLNWANDTATTEWILRIDADEVVTPELRDEIQAILNLKFQISNLKLEGDIVAYGIPRKQNFLGTFLTGGDWAYDRLTRLFKPQFCMYEPIVKVHEQFQVKGSIGYLKNALLHYSHPDLATLMKKFESYTSLEALELKETKLSAFLKLLIVPPYVFLRWMIYHHGYKDGWVGIKAGAMRAYYDIMLYSKFLRLPSYESTK
ncbi:MAG: glycosyltransferase family 2 protein [Candidatus Roizmanbacteria bacterium]|nr:glycosyltransferase family 2 protein [Candidatus Roizmanbacteria bacterium]